MLLLPCIFQVLMTYLDPASLGLEFHLAKSTQGHIKAGNGASAPFCSMWTYGRL